VDLWHRPPPERRWQIPLDLTDTRPHEIRLEYAKEEGVARIRLLWGREKEDLQVVPAEVLFHNRPGQ
jgi:hypothetical protein